ncbi:MAG: hypothetical protein Kilf2KO_23910 [Rhodospirillales bacterium]
MQTKEAAVLATRRLDRHLLVLSLWLPLGFVLLALFSQGLGLANGWLVAGAFATLLVGFVGHVIVNAVYKTFFSSRELALGLVVYVVALLGFLIALLFGSEQVGALFPVIGLGFLATAMTVIAYLVIHLGVRPAFEAFDVISDFRRRRNPDAPKP